MSYSLAFQKAVKLILAHEGGFTDNPKDDGNWTGGAEGVGELKGTNFGISAKQYPALDIRTLTVDQAIAIYHRDYWLRVRGDELPPALAVLVFDMAVNGGAETSIKLLQKALGVAEDGVLGPMTLNKSRATDPSLAARRFTVARIQRYAGMKRWPEFGRVWTDRSIESLLAAVGHG